jgi:hypothetical protein
MVISFADETTMDVPTPFLYQCQTLTMFDAIRQQSDEPLSIPGLDAETHGPLLKKVAGLDMHCHNAGYVEGRDVERVYDLGLGALLSKDLITLMEAADYLQHARSLEACTRLLASRVRGKASGDMCRTLGLDEVQSKLPWVLSKDSMYYPWKKEEDQSV